MENEAEAYPVCFTGKLPLSPHPVSQAAWLASPGVYRKLFYYEAEFVGGGSVGVGSAQAHMGAKDCHVG
jgi:hypothetical protein